MMKKVFYTLLATVAMLVTSCSNENIEIETVGRLRNLTCNVSTQNLYDEFQITEDVREILREESFGIGINTFIYDSKGSLVDYNLTFQYSFNNAKCYFTGLVEGQYTVVTIETLLSDKSYQKSNNSITIESPNWSFTGIDKLSTLKITQDDCEVYYPFVLGVCTQEVMLANDQSINIQPKAIGSKLQLCFLNFDQSTHPKVGFATNDVAASYSLNPNLPISERYNIDLTSVGYTNIRAQFNVDGKDEIWLTRYILEPEIKWNFCFKKKENAENSTWTHYYVNEGVSTLSNATEYYGGFYFVNDEKTCKSYFGSEEGFYEWYENECNTEEVSKDLIPEVCKKWESSVASVQSEMIGYRMTSGYEGQAVPYEDGSYGIEYAGNGLESKISYFFTSAETGLFEADVIYEKSSVTSEQIISVLNTNYQYLVDQDGVYMFCTSDYSTYVLFFEMNGSYCVGFVDVNYLANASKIKKPYNKVKMYTDKTISKIRQKNEKETLTKKLNVFKNDLRFVNNMRNLSE